MEEFLTAVEQRHPPLSFSLSTARAIRADSHADPHSSLCRCSPRRAVSLRSLSLTHTHKPLFRRHTQTHAQPLSYALSVPIRVPLRIPPRLVPQNKTLHSARQCPIPHNTHSSQLRPTQAPAPINPAHQMLLCDTAPGCSRPNTLSSQLCHKHARLLRRVAPCD